MIAAEYLYNQTRDLILMPTAIHRTSGGAIIEFDRGSFDDWCVYLTRPGQLRFAPKDTEYFARLAALGDKHGHQKIYANFVAFYLRTGKAIDTGVLELIKSLSALYADDAEEVETWFSVIYAGMVAEENKQNAILKKRIKRLGMYQVLIEKLEPDFAANFSKGKPWRELDKVMIERGF